MVTFFAGLPRADSDHWLSSFKRKTVSPFSLAVLLSFIVVSAVLVNVSSKTPFLDPLFQRLNSFGSLSSPPLLHWPFSVSYTGLGNDTTFGSPNVFGITQTIGNRSTELNQTAATSSDGKKEVFDNVYVGDVVDMPQDASFASNGSESAQDSIYPNASANNREPLDARLVDLNETVPISSDGRKKGFDKPQDSSFSNNGSKSDPIAVIAKGNENMTTETDAHLDKVTRSEGTKSPPAVTKSLKDCDLFDGRWVKDETLPYYPPLSCPYIDKDFDCHLNGRRDNEFEKWRWQPSGCEIPRFNATDFLERLRGQKLVFVGDSLNRNMWESLVCLLRHGVEDKSRVYEISGRHDFKKKGFYAFRYEDYNCSIDFVSSPFLVKESSFHGKNGSFETLRLDLMDDTTHMYHDADVLVFNTGHWWTHEKTSQGEDYYQEGNHVYPRLKVLEAFKKALTTWAKWVDTNIKSSHTQVIFRGFSVTHFRGGPWNSGGQCHQETEPIYNDTYLAKYPSKMKVLEYVLKDMQTHVSYLNISKLTDYRKDAHPSIYRPDYQSAQNEIHAQDCSHWCLPGVPDSWNELLYAALLKTGRGTWTWKA